MLTPRRRRLVVLSIAYTEEEALTFEGATDSLGQDGCFNERWWEQRLKTNLNGMVELHKSLQHFDAKVLVLQDQGPATE